MPKWAVAVLAFAGGAVAGALALRAYLAAHPELIAEAVGEKIFGKGTTGAKITGDIAVAAGDIFGSN